MKSKIIATLGLAAALALTGVSAATAATSGSVAPQSLTARELPAPVFGVQDKLTEALHVKASTQTADEAKAIADSGVAADLLVDPKTNTVLAAIPREMNPTPRAI